MTRLASASSRPSVVWCSQTGPFWLQRSSGRRTGAVHLGAPTSWHGGWHAAALLWLPVLPTETWEFLVGIDIGGVYKALLVSPERTPPSSFPAAQWQLRRRGNPSLSNLCCLLYGCYRWWSAACSCQMQWIAMKFCEMVGNCTCLHDTREAFVLNLHVFSLAVITDFTCYF
jgi:hypothetical protein